MFTLLLVLWIIFNGRFTVEILIFGIIFSTVICLFMNRFLDYSFKKEFARLKLLPSFLAYCCILLKEIFVANMVLLKLLFRKKKLTPVLYHFKSALNTELARTMLANSITLTPGTITVSMKGNEFVVHCLDESLAAGMEDSIFVKKLSAMEAKV